MSENDAMQALHEVGAIISDSHVVYTSGRHGKTYVNKDALYLHPHVTEQLCGLMATQYPPDAVDVVAGPTVGGVILAQWTAWHLTTARDNGEVLAIFAEEEGAGDEKIRVFRRGYDQQIPGRRILIVEDVVTTGGSARRVIDAVRALGGEIVGLSILCNRGGITAADVGGVPIHALTTVTDLESWPEEDCPLCRQGIPINIAVGKGKAFLARQEAKS
jgi:orotate phosphoribosyltransferase